MVEGSNECKPLCSLIGCETPFSVPACFGPFLAGVEEFVTVCLT